MLITQTNNENLRDIFCKCVGEVFEDYDIFLDFLENEEYSIIDYDCYFDPNGENYIINTKTGEYINWYKLYHLGRCISIMVNELEYSNIEKWIKDFLINFKESEDKYG